MQQRDQQLAQVRAERDAALRDKDQQLARVRAELEAAARDKVRVYIAALCCLCGCAWTGSCGCGVPVCDARELVVYLTFVWGR